MRALMVTRMLILCTYFGISLQGAGAKPQWMDNLAELYGRSSCKKRSHKAAWPLFQESLASLLPGEEGLARLGTDIRTGALSLADMPHVYAVIGGGEWGPRLVAKALLEAVYVKPWSHVTVVDLAVAAEKHRTQGLEEAQVWVKGMVAAAIRRCPGTAAVVFDNAHVLEGDDVLLLDPLLLLFDDSRSHMVDGEGKVSGEGSLFVLLLNEEASDQHSGLDGKGRLHLAWDYDGPAFTTKAFVGRVDGALLLSSSITSLTLSPGAQSSLKILESFWPKAANSPMCKQESGTCVTGLSDRTLKAFAATAMVLVATGAAVCLAWGCFRGGLNQNNGDNHQKTIQAAGGGRGNKPGDENGGHYGGGGGDGYGPSNWAANNRQSDTRGVGGDDATIGDTFADVQATVDISGQSGRRQSDAGLNVSGGFDAREIAALAGGDDPLPVGEIDEDCNAGGTSDSAGNQPDANERRAVDTYNAKTGTIAKKRESASRKKGTGTVPVPTGRITRSTTRALSTPQPQD